MESESHPERISESNLTLSRRQEAFRGHSKINTWDSSLYLLLSPLSPCPCLLQDSDLRASSVVKATWTTPLKPEPHVQDSTKSRPTLYHKHIQRGHGSTAARICFVCNWCGLLRLDSPVLALALNSIVIQSLLQNPHEFNRSCRSRSCTIESELSPTDFLSSPPRREFSQGSLGLRGLRSVITSRTEPA